MSQSITNLINTLGEAIAQQVADAEKRATEADARLEALRFGILSVFDGLNPPNQPLTTPANDHETIAPEKLTKRLNVSDEAYLAALNTEWSRAADIRNHLAACGIVVAEGTIYNRMRKIVGEHPDRVETTNGPERWRLKSSAENVGVEPTPSSAKTAKRGALKLAPSESTLVSETTPDFPSLAMLPQMLLGDCLNVMRSIPNQSVDLIVGDLPYGTTRSKYDSIIDLEAAWAEYRRIIKPKGNILQFGCQPFTNALINSAPDLFKYTMVWDKGSATGFPLAANKPLKAHEDIVLFEAHEDIVLFSQGTNISAKRSKRRAVFNPQGVTRVMRRQKKSRKLDYLGNCVTGGKEEYYEALVNCPRSILRFDKVKGKKGSGQHPFAKPVNLLEYLIRTYSDLGAVVLDNTMGEGSAMIAAMRTGRQGIGIEMEDKWFARANMLVGNEHEAMLAAGVKFEAAKVMSANDNVPAN
jgi:site-specific DNA-methyltransferase (adenine-specific)